jgi:hypothetical protein
VENGQVGSLALEAAVAALVDGFRLASLLFPCNWSNGQLQPGLSISITSAPTLLLNQDNFEMSGEDKNPKKRKAEPRELQDGGDKRAKVSSFLRATVKTPPVLAVLALQFHSRRAAAVRFIILI